MTLSGGVVGTTGEVLSRLRHKDLAVPGKRIAQSAATAGQEGPDRA
jgi:hypothetical protein